MNDHLTDHLSKTEKKIEDYPSLVFVNSRSAAETVSQRLAAIAPEIKIGVHHGSLASETRKEMEDKLRNGDLHAFSPSTMSMIVVS